MSVEFYPPACPPEKNFYGKRARREKRRQEVRRGGVERRCGAVRFHREVPGEEHYQQLGRTSRLSHDGEGEN